MTPLPRDDNRVSSLGGTSTVTGLTLAVGAIPITGVNPLIVAIVDGSGNQITSFGGGTQYTQGGTPPTHPIAPTLMFDNAGTWTNVSVSNPLPIAGSFSVTGGATALAQTDGSQKTQIVDGSGNVIGATSNAIDVNIKSGSSAGIQYTDAGTPPTHPIGNAMEFNNAGAWATVGSVNPLPVTSNLITGFALETGGNLATVAGAVSASKVNVNISSGSIANTSFASTIADGADATLGAKADNKSTATDTTAITAMSVLKEISYMEQNPASRSVTNTGTFAVQATLAASSGTDIGKLTANQSVNMSQINAHTTLEGGVNGSQAVGGTGAESSAITGSPLNTGGTAITAEKTVTHNGDAVGFVSDLTGKQIVMPYANKENFVSGIASVANTADTAVIAAQGAGLFIYITSISVVNTGATASLVTIETDTASAKTAIWYMMNPAGGGDNITFPTPLKVPVANKNLGFVCGASSTTQYCSISGYFGT